MNLQSIKEWFSSGYDLHKAILVSVGGVCVVLMVLLFLQMSYSSRLNSALVQAERDTKSLCKAAKEIYEVKKQIQDDALSSESASIRDYINNQAFAASIGFVPQNEKTEPGKVFEDRRVYITTDPKDKILSRDRIADFFYRIENNTSRARVTYLKLEAPTKDFKTGERRDDAWTMTAEVTSRRRVGK